jgi:hypothetical protein
MLLAGMGGIVLCATPEERANWLNYAEKTGRMADVVVLDASGSQRFNFLDYAAKTFAKQGFDHNLTSLMARMVEAARVADDSKGGGGGENQFFTDSAMLWMSHAFPLLRLAYGVIRLEDLNKFLGSAPRSLDQIASPAAFNQWAQTSFCGKTHVLAGARAERAKGAHHQRAMKILDEHGDFFLERVPALDQRPRSSIEATLDSLLYPFLSGKLRELFCVDTTVSPDMARQGDRKSVV